MTTPVVSQFSSPTIPGLTDDEQRTVGLLIAQLAAKAPRNLLRAAFYDMKNVIRDLGISTPPSMQNVPHVLGWSAKAVDTLNRRCPLDGFVTPGVRSEDGDPFGIQKVWTDNYLDLEAAQAGVSSLIHAASFLIATQGDTDRDEPEVLVTARDALSGTGEWSRRLRRLTSFLSVIDTDDAGGITEFVLYLPNLNVTCIKDPLSRTWTVDRSEHSYGLPVEVLPYQPRLGRPFGSSRISRSVMSLHGAAVRSFRRSESTAEFYAATRVALLGAGEEAFTNADGSPASKWTAALSAIWAIPDDEDAANPRATLTQITQASQEPHMAQLRSLAQLFAGETNIPLSSLGISGDANPTSSEAYDAGRDDLMQEAEGTTDGWSPGWRRTMLRALSMLNGWDTPPPEALTLAPKWRDPRTPSRAAAADAAVKLITVFPWLADTREGLELAGLDEQFITRALAAKRQVNGRATLTRILPPAPVDDGSGAG